MKRIQTPYIQFIGILTILLAFAACEDDFVDTTKPVIRIEAPANNDTLYIGHDVHFDCEFEDDTELHSYKIDIHNNFDGHTHKSARIEGEETPFSYSNSWTFTPGQKNATVHHHELIIPELIDNLPVAHGKYHFGIFCTDKAGNESHIFIDVVLAEGDGDHDHH